MAPPSKVDIRQDNKKHSGPSAGRKANKKKDTLHKKIKEQQPKLFENYADTQKNPKKYETPKELKEDALVILMIFF